MGNAAEERITSIRAISDTPANFVRQQRCVRRGESVLRRSCREPEQKTRQRGTCGSAFDRISVAEILDRAKVSRSTFYIQFRDKDELLTSSMRSPVEADTLFRALAMPVLQSPHS